jgi:hypothetical protein
VPPKLSASPRAYIGSSQRLSDRVIHIFAAVFNIILKSLTCAFHIFSLDAIDDPYMLFAGCPQSFSGGNVCHADEVKSLVNGTNLLEQGSVTGPDGKPLMELLVQFGKSNELVMACMTFVARA